MAMTQSLRDWVWLAFVCVVILAPFSVHADWVSRTVPGPQGWSSVAVSSDGTKVAASSYDGYVFTSTDSGATWTRHELSGLPYLQTITASADGVFLATAEYGGYIYTSSDGGATWATSTTGGSRNWYSIAVSDDGTFLVAGVDTGYIYTSTDSGATWATSTTAGSRRWRAVATSDDGSKLVAASGSNGYIYTSTDSGATWATSTTAGTGSWHSLSSSGDGVNLVASEWSGSIFTSADSGANWTERVAAGNREWVSVDSSDDGSVIFAVEVYGDVYVSTDSGVSWAAKAISPGIDGREWQSVSVSDDGTRAVAVILDGFAYTTTNSGDAWTLRAAAPYTDRWYSVFYSGDGSQIIGLSEAPGTIVLSDDHGATWTAVEEGTYEPFRSAALSYDGTKIAIQDQDCKVWTSTDSGATWTERTDNSVCIQYDIASTDDGTTLVGVGNADDEVWVSTDSGATWTAKTGNQNPLPIVPNCCSGDFNHLVMSGDADRIIATRTSTADWLYMSTDVADTWTTMVSAGYKSWSALAMSDDGMHVVGGTHNGYLFISTDGGSTWATSTAAGSRWWRSLTISDDGQTIAAMASPGYIYFSTDGGSTWDEQNGGADPGSRGWGAYEVLSGSADGSRYVAAGWTDATLWTYPAGAVYSAPTVSTDAASTVEDTTVTLNGTIDDVGTDAPTTRGFTYGETTAYGATTTENNGGGFSAGAYTADVSSLTCATTYHFRAYVTNGTETVYGSDDTFTTDGCSLLGGGGGGGIKISLSNLFGFGNDEDATSTQSDDDDSLLENILDIFGSDDEPVVAPPAIPPAGDVQAPVQGGGATNNGAGNSTGVGGSGRANPPTNEVRDTEAQPVDEAPALLPSQLPSDISRLMQSLGAYGAVALGFLRAHDQELAVTALTLGSLLWLLKYILMGTGLLLRMQSVTDFTYIIRGAWDRFLTTLGIRKKRRHWGTVYDAKSKQALDPALVELLDAETGATLEESFTDIQGHYGFLDRIGAFVIRAKKTNYAFPSREVAGDNDVMFEHLYHGERFEIHSTVSDAITPNIPMDQIATDWNQEEKKRMGLQRGIKLDAFIADISGVIFWVGYTVALAVLFTTPNVLHGIFAFLYTGMAGISTYWPPPRLWGQLTSARRSVAHLTIVLRHREQQSVIVSRAQSDASGRFFLKAVPGDYLLDVMARQEVLEVSIFKREVRVKEGGTVNDTIRI